MNWEERKNKIYYLDGSFRDVVVKNTSLEDWGEMIYFLNKNYKVKQKFLSLHREESFIDFDLVKKYWLGEGINMSTVSVYLDSIIINTHFFSDVEIEFDINPKEINSLEDDIKITKFIKELSNLLNKEVVITPQDEHNVVLFSSNGK